MYDAVTLFGKILREKFLAFTVVSTNGTDVSSQIINDETVPRCNDKNSWKHGLSIISDIKVVGPNFSYISYNFLAGDLLLFLLGIHTTFRQSYQSLLLNCGIIFR